MDMTNFKATTNAGTTRIADSTGYHVGTAYGDFTAHKKEQGVFNPNTTATVPYIWGGRLLKVGISPTGGAMVDVAANAGEVGGIAVHTASGVATHSSNVPQVGKGDMTAFYRKGSGVRVALAIDTSAAAALAAGTATDLGWDFTNNKAIAGTGLLAMGFKIVAVDAKANSRGVSVTGTNTSWQDGVSAVVVEL